ncbi:MAG: DUF349 domain-containing protein [Bacteroidales bacterium]|jgi:hypothetical protein
MVELDPKDSVRDEQFGETEDMKDKKSKEKAPEKKNDKEDESKSGSKKVKKAAGQKSTGKKETTAKSKPGNKEKKKKVIKGSEEDTALPEKPSEEKPESEEKKKEEKEQAGKSSKEDTESDGKESGEEQTGSEPPSNEPEKIDYTKLSKEDLVKVLKDLIDSGEVGELRGEVESIKSNFYKKLKADHEAIKKKFLDEGGQLEDFKLEENPVETELKELLQKYKELKNEYNKKLEEDKVKNLEEKYRIIEGIKELVNSQESLNKTFHDFRELQSRWHETGPVPQQNLKDLWESYHYQVEAFYDYIKINKELRDLDLKKNLEAKIKLCERAEELLLEPSVVEAFRQLQKLHDRWREVGPVPIDKRTEIWERFKGTTSKINRKHQEYFVNLKQEQKKNYEEKLLLCEKAEEINTLELENHKDWEEKSKELIELQKVWKSIGFAPKKHNTQVYERFRKACDGFFDKKRRYYSHNREEQQHNLELKTELCIQAEALQDNTDWKKTTNEMIALQKRWKEIGPVPIKQSDKIWKRFRAACDVFFNNKSNYFSRIDTRYEENLKMKNDLIKEIEDFKLTDQVDKNLESLNELQRRWSEIGYVPLRDKNEVQERYRQAINSKFDQLKLDESKKSLLKFRSRVENIVDKPNSSNRLRNEREKCFNKLKQLENDITLWENNIGFFTESENAESMITDVNKKIENARKKIEQLKGKIRIIDEFED